MIDLNCLKYDWNQKGNYSQVQNVLSYRLHAIIMRTIIIGCLGNGFQL